MSVTRIESWLANPYSVFARSILRLSPLDPIEAAPDMSVRGRIIHEALHRFTVQYPDALPDDAAGRLEAIAGEILVEYAAHPRVAAFWRPRLKRFAQWFAETEGARRKNIAQIITETGGAMKISAPAGDFILTARADRIDLTEDGRAVIYDYKSGTAPVRVQGCEWCFASAAAGSSDRPGGRVREHSCNGRRDVGLHNSQWGEPPGEERRIKAATDELAATSLRELGRLVADFDQEDTDYRAVRRAAFADAYRYDDYAHLARVQEWSLGDGDD